jgi:hypothetical protein
MSQPQTGSPDAGRVIEIKHNQTFKVLRTVPGVTLEAADLQGAELTGAGLVFRNLTRADLRKADLQRADLRYATLRDADLRGANLKGAVLDGADLRGAKLEGAQVGGASFVRCTGIYEPRAEQMRLQGATLDDSAPEGDAPVAAPVVAAFAPRAHELTAAFAAPFQRR